MSDGKLPSGIDRIVGQRLRWRRRELKLTQEQLGEQLGLTFQQVQKYEKGINRVSAGRLFEMGKALGVDIAYFFDGAEDYLTPQSFGVAEETAPAALPSLDGDALDLVAAYQRIEDPGLKRAMLAAVKAAAEAFAAR